jgi:hypothetical protein
MGWDFLSKSTAHWARINCPVRRVRGRRIKKKQRQTELIMDKK